MRPKVLLLIALLIMVGFYCGCAVDMSSKDQTPDETDKLCKRVQLSKGWVLTAKRIQKRS